MCLSTPPAAVQALPLAAAALAAIGAGMVLLWLWQRRTRNAAIVDVGWTVGLGLLGIAYALLLEGSAMRRALLGIMVGLWSLRLAVHLVRDRVAGRPEEGRYERLRAHWGDRAQPYLLLFFLAQAVLAAGLSLAFLPGMQDERPAPDVFDLAGLALWVVAWAGEAIADRQLARFKAAPDSVGRVCERGLWAWSRHPNYFFEWLIWLAFVLPGLPSSWGWLSLLAPIAMLLFILKVTGVPTSEAQALRSRGDTYRAYQRRVSVFIPLPPSTRGVS
jgi:steroid 5-alpha reductase family enzyme